MTRRTSLGLWRQIETLAVATAGGALVAALGVPGAWLSGAMMSTALLTGAGRGAAVAHPIRNAALACAGLTIGAGVTPQMIDSFAHYPASLALMAASLSVSTVASTAFIVATTGWSRATALFSSIPGALSYVLALAPGAGADLARVGVVQLARVFVLIAVIPLIVGGSLAQPGAAPGGAIDGPLWIVGTLGAGMLLGFGLERLRVAGGMLFGTMIVAAALHGSGLAPGRLPGWMQILGQVLIGAWGGSRFAQLDLALLRAAIWPTLGSLVIAMAIAIVFALMAAATLGLPYADAVVAYAPGGLEAMTLLAFTLGLDPLYVGSHHLARFIMISLALPFVLRFTLGDRRG